MNREPIKFQSKIIASDTQELYDLAKSKGMVMPHPALGVFKSVLAEIEKPNSNKYRLGRKATEAAISTIIGCQINKNHSVQKDEFGDFIKDPDILGHVIDASINDNDEIEIVCVFFKKVYSNEWDEAQELFSKNKLTMSLEISADIESQDKLSDGTKRVNDYYFTGAGLLFGLKPACKNARVFLMATKQLNEKLSMERQSLIFANNQNSQKSIMEVLNLMAEEVKKIEEIKAEESKAEETKVEETKVEETKAEESKVEETKVEETKAEETKVEETKVEETKAEETKVEETKAEEKPESQETRTQTIQVVKTEVVSTPDSTEQHTVIHEADKTTYPSGNTQTHIITQETVEKWIWEQVQAMQAKHESEVKSLKEQLEAKDKEVENLKASKKTEEEVKAKEEIVLATGHKKIEASEEDNINPICKVLRAKRNSRK